jgi:hypothetical protein
LTAKGSGGPTKFIEVYRLFSPLQLLKYPTGYLFPGQPDKKLSESLLSKKVVNDTGLSTNAVTQLHKTSGQICIVYNEKNTSGISSKISNLIENATYAWQNS